MQPKNAGRLVYRYESATIQETKDLITKVIGDANEAPGPGSYTLPEVPALHGAPSLKGRSLPFAMPHPYAYNCAPDTMNKYSLVPVRQSNNADQIFGIGLRRGHGNVGHSMPFTGQSKARPSSAGHDQVSLKDLRELPQMPSVVNENDMDPDTVQWKSGGFTTMKKSRSTASVRPEHPSVGEAMKVYPALSRKHRSTSAGDRSFLPMASRRSEVIPTGEASEEFQKLQRSKWQLSAYGQILGEAAAAAMEPLDLEKLREEAMVGIRDKAMFRMKLDGVPKDQYDSILQEMSLILRQKRGGEDEGITEDEFPAFGSQEQPEATEGP